MCLLALCVHPKAPITEDGLNDQVDSVILPSASTSSALGHSGARGHSGFQEPWSCDYHWVTLGFSGQPSSRQRKELLYPRGIQS